jgi:hypothetical protein
MRHSDTRLPGRNLALANLPSSTTPGLRKLRQLMPTAHRRIPIETRLFRPPPARSHPVVMNTAGAVVLTIVLLLLAAGIGWVIFTRVRASRLGVSSFFLSRPSPALIPISISSLCRKEYKKRKTAN